MAVIDKRTTSKGTRWRARIRRREGTLTKTFDRKSDAVQWATATEAAMDRGDIIQTRITVGDIIRHYVDDVLPHKGRKDSAKTVRQLAHWRRVLGDLPAANLTPALIDEHRRALLRGRTAATANRYWAALSVALSEAVRQGWLRDNPAKKLNRLAEPEGRDRILTEDERRDLLAACAERDADLYLLVLLALVTAARAGELRGLVWDRVDTDRGRLLFLETKNGHRRAVPVTGRALQLLRERRGTGRLFPREMRAAWRNSLKAAGITDFRFHDLRHTAISAMAAAGISQPLIMAVSGHKTANMSKRYTHLTADDTTGAINTLSGIIDE